MLAIPLAAAAYGAWVWGRIAREFDDRAWNTPAQVFAAPLDLHVGRRLTAQELAAELQPDVMLLDIAIPGGGIEAATAIVASGSPVKVVMLTGSDDEERVTAALAAGARGYLLKGTNAGELLEAVRLVNSGGFYITPALSSRLLVRAVRAAGSANGANHVPVLIPCHCVVRSDGSLGGYAYGLAIKQKLLEREKQG